MLICADVLSSYSKSSFTDTPHNWILHVILQKRTFIHLYGYVSLWRKSQCFVTSPSILCFFGTREALGFCTGFSCNL